jgi:hypothetical protein
MPKCISGPSMLLMVPTILVMTQVRIIMNLITIGKTISGNLCYTTKVMFQTRKLLTVFELSIRILYSRANAVPVLSRGGSRS